MTITIRLLILLLLISVSACESKLTYSYSYLIEHPTELLKQAEYCQSIANKSQKDIAQCKIVIDAATTIFPIVKEQQLQPEKFGQKILDLEIAKGKTQQELSKQEQLLTELKKKSATTEELKAAEDRVEKLRKKLADQQQELQLFLGVVAINSPE